MPQSQNHDLSIIKSQMHNQLNHSGAPSVLSLRSIQNLSINANFSLGSYHLQFVYLRFLVESHHSLLKAQPISGEPWEWWSVGVDG